MEYIMNFLLSLGTGFTTIGAQESASTLYSTTTIEATNTTIVGTEHIENEDALLGTTLTATGTTIFNAANNAMDNTKHYYETHQYVESLSEEELASAIEELGVTIEEHKPKTLTRHI